MLCRGLWYSYQEQPSQPVWLLLSRRYWNALVRTLLSYAQMSLITTCHCLVQVCGLLLA